MDRQLAGASRLVQPYDVHYVSTSQRALVPDTRWFPVDKLATRLARAQLRAGVRAHLADAAVTAVPAGARLLGDAVSIESGVATVNLLSDDQLTAGETTRQNLWAQFVSTLTQDTGVSRVELSVNGVPVNVAGLDGPAGTLADVGFTTPAAPALARPVVRRGDDVVGVRPEHAGRPGAAAAGGVGHLPAGAAHLPAARAVGRRRELAGVDPGGDGISRWRGTNRYEVPLDAATSATPPTTGAATCGWVGSAPRAPRRHGCGSSTSRPTRPTRGRGHRGPGRLARGSARARGARGPGR